MSSTISSSTSSSLGSNSSRRPKISEKELETIRSNKLSRELNECVVILKEEQSVKKIVQVLKDTKVLDMSYDWYNKNHQCKLIKKIALYGSIGSTITGGIGFTVSTLCTAGTMTVPITAASAFAGWCIGEGIALSQHCFSGFEAWQAANIKDGRKEFFKKLSSVTGVTLLECPLSSETILDPVTLTTCASYFERSVIVNWVYKEKRDPYTHEKIDFSAIKDAPHVLYALFKACKIVIENASIQENLSEEYLKGIKILFKDIDVRMKKTFSDTQELAMQQFKDGKMSAEQVVGMLKDMAKLLNPDISDCSVSASSSSEKTEKKEEKTNNK